MPSLLGLGNFGGGFASGLDEASIQQLRRQQIMQQMREQALENARMRAISQIPSGGIPGIPGVGGGGAIPGAGGGMMAPKGIGNPAAPFAGAQAPGAASQAAPMSAPPPQPTTVGPTAAQPTSFGAPMANDAFGSVMDRVFGKGNWIQTSGFRPPAQEAALRAAGAPTVPAGATSAHSTGTPNAPGARDIVVKGMTPQQAAAKLSAMGVKFKSVMPESPYTTRDGRQHGAHLHIDPQMGSTAQPYSPQSSNTTGKAQQGQADATPPPTGGSQGSQQGMDRDSLISAYQQLQEQTSPATLSRTIGAVSDYFRKQNPDANPVIIGAMTEAYFKAAAEAAGAQKQMTAADLLFLRGTQQDEQIDRRGNIQAGLQSSRETEQDTRQDKSIAAAKERQATSISAAQQRQDRAIAASNARFQQSQAGIDRRFAQRASAGLNNGPLRAQRNAIVDRRKRAMDAYNGLKVAGIIPDEKQAEAAGYTQDIAKADSDLIDFDTKLGAAATPAAAATPKPAGKGRVLGVVSP